MTKNDRWKTFRKEVTLVWNLMKYGWCKYLPETLIAAQSWILLILLILSVVGWFMGFNELANRCALLAAALFLGLLLSIYSASRVFADREFQKFNLRKLLYGIWHTDLSRIQTGSEDGEVYLVVVTFAGYLHRTMVFDTKIQHQALEMLRTLDIYAHHKADIHYIKVSDLLRLSLDAEEIRHELE